MVCVFLTIDYCKLRSSPLTSKKFLTGTTTNWASQVSQLKPQFVIYKSQNWVSLKANRFGKFTKPDLVAQTSSSFAFLNRLSFSENVTVHLNSLLINHSNSNRLVNRERKLQASLMVMNIHLVASSSINGHGVRQIRLSELDLELGSKYDSDYFNLARF